MSMIMIVFPLNSTGVWSMKAATLPSIENIFPFLAVTILTKVGSVKFLNFEVQI